MANSIANSMAVSVVENDAKMLKISNLCSTWNMDGRSWAAGDRNMLVRKAAGGPLEIPTDAG